MDRRGLGAVLVLAAVIVALVLPSLDGRRVAGAGSRVPIPSQPAVGNCLMGAAERHSALNYPGAKVLTVATGPCGGATFGEVVSVAEDARAFPSAMAYNDNSRPQSDACGQSARSYLGWDRSADGGRPAPDAAAVAAWNPVVTQSVVLIGPDLSQYLTGQRWIACVVLPQQAPYWGSIRGGATSSSAADAYGWCRAHTGTPAERALSCALPHDSEVLGWTSAGASAAALMTSCTALVRTVTGLSDPTAAGRLKPSVELDKTIGSQSGSGEAGSALARCVLRVEGNLRLGGGLTGIGDGPLPWR
jgi:hypothetical protein